MWRWQSRNTTPARFQDISIQLDACLDRALAHFPPGVVAEVMLYAPSTQCLITVAIRPDIAVLLPTRLRVGEGIAGRVLETGKPFGGRASQNTSYPRLISTRSALTTPILAKRFGSAPLVGVLNIESHDESLLTPQSGERLGDIIAEIAGLLAGIPAATFTDNASSARFLLDKIEKEIAFILDPHQLREIYQQIRQAAARLTSQPDTIASIILRLREAQHLSFAGAREDDGGKIHEWVVPVPNVGDAVNLPEEWDLLAEPSITGEVMEQGVMIYLNDVSDLSARTRRKPIPPPYDRGSELNVPIADMNGVFGTIVLLSQRPDAFSPEDQRMAKSIARYLAVVTRRIESFREAESQNPRFLWQDKVKGAIDDLIAPLHTSEEAFSRIHTIRDRVLELIAEEAKLHTESQVGAVVLAERASASDGTVELVWNKPYYKADIEESPIALMSRPFRLPMGDGLVGYTFESAGDGLIVPDVHHPEIPELEGKYVDAFPRVQSELVVPLQGRSKRWGVIDVESTKLRHYNLDHKRWIQFLAREAVEALEAIELAARRWFQRRLSEFDGEMARMRASSNLEEIQRMRGPLLQRLTDETLLLTGADSVQIYVAVNAYDEDGQLKRDEKGTPDGALGVIVTSPSEDYLNPKLRRHIRITEGMAGHVVRTGQPDFFKDSHERPLRFVENMRDTKSALVEPICEGTRVIAILNLESERSRWCGEMQLNIASYAARLASSILVGYRMCMERAQAHALHEFEPVIEHLERPDLTDFLRKVLVFADQLTTSPDARRWAQVALVQDQHLDYAVSTEFPIRGFVEESDTPITYSAFLNSIRSLQPSFIPNVKEPPHPEDGQNLPWSDAQSLLCAPLVLSDADERRTTIGLLTVASSRPYYLNDSDQAALGRFAETVTHGLQDVARLYSRVTLMREVRERFGAFRLPDSIAMEDLRKAIRSIPEARNGVKAAIKATESFRSFEDPLRLVEQLPHWYLILSNFYPSPTLNAAQGSGGRAEGAVTLGEIIDALAPLMETYVKEQVGGSVVWRWEPWDRRSRLRELRLWAGQEELKEEAQQVLKASVFGCIASASAASRRGGGDGYDIRVVVTEPDASVVKLAFKYVGRAPSRKAFSQIPRYRLDEYTKQHIFEVPERRLLEVRRIANVFGGDVTIPPSESNIAHSIELVIPHQS